MYKEKYDKLNLEVEKLTSNHKIEYEKYLMDLNQTKEDLSNLNRKLEKMGEENKQCLNHKMEHEQCSVDLDQTKKDLSTLNEKIEKMGEESKQCLKMQVEFDHLKVEHQKLVVNHQNLWETYKRLKDDSEICIDKMGRQMNKNNDFMEKCLQFTPEKVTKDGGWFGRDETTEKTYNKYCEIIAREYISFNNDIRNIAPALHRLIENVKDNKRRGQ